MDNVPFSRFLKLYFFSLVELPPEGKAANEVFVELPPSQKEKQSYYHSQEIVELPADDAMHDDEEDVVYENTSREISPRCSAPTCSRLRRCLSDGEESNDKSFTSPASSRPNVQRQKVNKVEFLYISSFLIK